MKTDAWMIFVCQAQLVANRSEQDRKVANRIGREDFDALEVDAIAEWSWYAIAEWSVGAPTKFYRALTDPLPRYGMQDRKSLELLAYTLLLFITDRTYSY